MGDGVQKASGGRRGPALTLGPQKQGSGQRDTHEPALGDPGEQESQVGKDRVEKRV